MERVTRQRMHLGLTGIGILLCTLLTACAHLYLSTHPDEDLRFWFLLNGLGYLALLIAYFLPQFNNFHTLIRWALIGYTALTIVLWFFLGSPSEGQIDPFDITVKVIEALLLVFLLLDSGRLGRRRA